MRRIVLTLLLALLSLGFAPAPFPKAERPPARESEQARRDRLLYECRQRLHELGVEWRVEERGDRRSVRFSVRHPGGKGTLGGDWGVSGGDLTRTLRQVVVRVEEFLGLAHRLKP
jgi:hypothetical protein